MTLPIQEVHAEGHFRRRRYTLKMLLSGDLVGKEFILTDQKFTSARFFLFGETPNFFENLKILPGTQFLPRLWRDTNPSCAAVGSTVMSAASRKGDRKPNYLRRLRF